jgi:hypothetical protein
MNSMCFINIAFLLILSLVGCKEQPTSPVSQNILQLDFVSGSISANFMPPLPLDTIWDQYVCELVIVAKNSSQTDSLNGIQIKQADVFISSTNQRLGTWNFFTRWDGKLGPNEKDTIKLRKVSGRLASRYGACYNFVYLNFIVNKDANHQIKYKSDSIFVSCDF